ncbi:MAG: putative metal-binding motif-containing protein, partial [Deltaproteobacteria bacterium]|nr:putative metal-binding motif-containing protein [Deltaproteobacteria bacterium]
GCADDGSTTDDGGTDVDGDAGDQEPDDADDSEWGWECEVDEDCGDGIDCTVDVCDRGLCRNTPDDSLCQDDQVCNGREICYPRDGCGPGEPYRDCDDGDPCTMDRCVEPEPGFVPDCLHLPLDRDMDTYVDLRCGGDDCNDIDPLSNPDAMERCFDTFDNDCDGFTDALDPTCQMDFDNCTSPRELAIGTEWEAFNEGATADVASSCDGSSYVDVVFSFTLTEASDVLVSVGGGDSYVYVSLQRECGDTASELRCGSDLQISFYQRALEPGTYYVVVSSWSVLTFLIRVDAWPAGPPAEGDTCDDPIELTLPAHVVQDTTRMSDDFSIRCASWMDGADTVYTFELTEPRDVTIDVASARITPYVALQTACDDSSTALVCDYGWPFHRTLGALPAGTYYLWVESSDAGSYSVDVSTAPPSPPPENDLCAGAIDISAGGRFTGNLLASSDDYAISCSSTPMKDVTYVFTLAEPQAVTLSVVGNYGLTPYTVVTTECGSTAAEVVCQWYEYPTMLEWRMLDAGTYYVLVKSDDEGTFDLQLTLSEPSDPCAGLERIEASGTWSGTTVGTFDDGRGTCGGSGGPDVAYELVLAEEATVGAEITVATWDTVLYLRTACADPTTELACNDDYSGLRSRIDPGLLAAGTYYLFVDGLYSGAYGDYTLQVTITP